MKDDNASDEIVSLVPIESTGLSLTRDPEAILADASKAATALMGMVRAQGLAIKLGGNKEHLMIEAWMALAAFYRLTVGADIVEANAEGNGYRAHARVITADGIVVSEAWSGCSRDESNWRTKPAFQLESMAQTRACSKALRLALGWVAVIAGYSATPAEEMAGDSQKTSTPERPSTLDADVKASLKNSAKRLNMTGPAVNDWLRKQYGGTFPSLSDKQKMQASGKLEEIANNAVVTEPKTATEEPPPKQGTASDDFDALGDAQGQQVTVSENDQDTPVTMVGIQSRAGLAGVTAGQLKKALEVDDLETIADISVAWKTVKEKFEL